LLLEHLVEWGTVFLQKLHIQVVGVLQEPRVEHYAGSVHVLESNPAWTGEA
jgi:hypothetical protein